MSVKKDVLQFLNGIISLSTILCDGTEGFSAMEPVPVQKER